MEESSSKVNNLFIGVGLNESNELMTSHYVARLNRFSSDEKGMVRVF